MRTAQSTDTVRRGGTSNTGGRSRARRLMLLALAAIVLLASPLSASDPAPQQDVSVSEESGVYTVAAVFAVPQEAALASAVLTDYEEIPRFMPDIRKSVVIAQTSGFIVVEQEAVARMFMLSKRVHLLLEIHQEAGEIRFRDRAGKSFTRYEGTWRITQAEGRTLITYRLSAQPAFEVPQFLLARLLKRDAQRMIEGLRTEIARRDAPSSSSRRSGGELASFH